MKRKLAASLLVKSGGCALLGKVVRWSGVLCLNYHRVGAGADSPYDRELWSASAEDFDAQMGFVKRHFDVISPDDLSDLPRGQFVLVTFDDGYLDNYTAAFPILKNHNLRATFFITTGFLDGRRLAWWDEIAWITRRAKGSGADGAIRERLGQYKSLASDQTGPFLESMRCGVELPADDPWMTWEMVREMRAAGMTIGGHTVSHPVLSRMPRNHQWEEISGCARRIEQELGEPMRYFSYPVGGPSAFNEDTRDCLRRAGVRYAFSYYGGFNRPDSWDEYDIRRTAVEADIGLDLFRSMATLPQVFVRSATEHQRRRTQEPFKRKNRPDGR